MADVSRKQFKEGELETLSRLIADTNEGLTGSQIEFFLRATNNEDVDPGNTKWRRLYNALANKQNNTQAGNCVLSFISKSLTPSRFVDKSEYYRNLLEKINTVLLFHGLEFRDDGKFHLVRAAQTLTESEIRASKLHEKVASRNLHAHLLYFCRAELLQENYFHAILEASKSIASMIRAKTGLVTDGALLIDEAFSGSSPLLKPVFP